MSLIKRRAIGLRHLPKVEDRVVPPLQGKVRTGFDSRLRCKLERMIEKIKSFRRRCNTTVYKWYRLDKNLYEEKRVVLWGITYYRYSIWDRGKVITRIRKKPYPGKAEYLKEAYETKVYVGRKEFEEKYKGNKWAIPINKELNLDLP